MAPESFPRFGDLLRAYRRAKGWTQEELAERSGLSARGISDLERGVNQAPWRDTALALAAALDLTPEQRDELLRARQRVTPLSKPTPLQIEPHAPPRTPQVPFIGRVSELRQAERLLARDDALLLLYYGEAGIGKSRLLEEATGHAQRQGWITLHGGAEQSSGQHPYAPLVQALGNALSEQTLAQRRQSLKRCEWMARLLPEVMDASLAPVPSWQLTPEQERRLIFAAVARYLGRLAAGASGVLLVLDDMQWATLDGLNLLMSLIRSSSSSAEPFRLRVVAAARDIPLDASHPFARSLAELARDGLVTRVSLGPLPLEHADALLHAALADAEGITPEEREAAIRMALARADGVPYFLMSFARELRDHPHGDGQKLLAADVPWDVQAMVSQWMSALPPAGQKALEVAALNGRETPLAVLASACDLSGQEVVEAVEAAYAAHLLVETSDAACVFEHDLVREAVLATLSVARERLLHARLAEALAADPAQAPPASLAFHYIRGAEKDQAVVHLERAGDQAWNLRASAAAEACYRDALNQLPAQGRADARARILEKLGELFMGCGRYADAIGALEEAAANFKRVGDRDGEGRAVAQIGWAHVRGGTGELGLTRVEPLLIPAALEALKPATQAELWRAHAILLFGQNRYSEQLISARRAAALARAINDTRALARSQRVEGLALVQLGRLDDALPVLRDTIRSAEVVGDLDSLSAALNDSAAVYRMRGELAASWTYSGRAVEVAERMGDPTAMAFFASSHGDNAFLLGDWAKARESYERAIGIVCDMGSSWVVAYPLISLGALNLAEGHDAAATRLLNEALSLAERGADLQAQRIVQAALAERELLRGEAADALRRLQPLVDTTTTDAKDSIALLPLVGWALVAQGDLASAASTLDLCLQRAGETGNRLVILDGLLAQARLRLHQGDWGHARESLDDALALAQRMAHRYAEVKARMLMGELFAALHLPEQAREQYERALSLCRRLSEALYRPRIERALQQLPGA